MRLITLRIGIARNYDMPRHNYLGQWVTCKLCGCRVDDPIHFYEPNRWT